MTKFKDLKFDSTWTSKDIDITLRPSNKTIEYIIEPYENSELHEKINEIIDWINEHERKGD